MDYRAYILNDERHIIGVHKLNCADDDEAKQQAAKLLDGHQITITAEQSKLTVEGRKADKGDHNFLFQGISMRPFRRVFNLAGPARR